MSKAWKIILIVVSSLLITILIAGSVYYFWPWHRDFFKNADDEFDIPGLDTSFCPQGMTEIEGYNKYLISGYMDDGSPSRFYLIDAETKNVDKYIILNIDGKLYNGHAGGVASYGSTLWTFSKEGEKGYGFRFKVSDIINAENGGEIKLGSYNYFETWNGADFAFVTDKILWVGEFYRDDNYLTDTNHHLTTRTGETNPAIIYGFNIDEGKNTGLSDTTPKKAISVRGLVQGIALTEEGNFVVSTSYSIPNSIIYYYKDILNEEAHDTLKIGLTEMDLWYLDNKSLIKETSIPSMSEEIFVKNNRVYILFESACKKYKMFNRTRIDSVYSVPVDYFAK